MYKVIWVSVFLLVAGFAAFAEETEQRAIKNENIGTVILNTPTDWTPVERHHTDSGTTSYRLTSPKEDSDLEILFNDLKHMRMEALRDKNMERYIENKMARAVPRSTEGKAKAKRFGVKKDGAYVRLTDKAPKPGEPLYFTQGVRLLGKEVVLFTLYSNDKDEAVLKKVLAIIDSVRIEPNPSGVKDSH